ncbi:hypothetical protein RB614_23935 [Phytohabitans sp. ZYX-F-186]|uniref:Cupin 2 conserved barrel domain-containing protein n=1 Tax=Phytohabitans maris TaxID=3071409 RepID=A0ABU0ZKJ8_9ACTN|nr:hypothetical protein [Phytohabitans sp. ZYX-F-186]MDQ7907576.1 hypothetical protein [Phytohabitans sp. ZYX-F-186]
MSDSGEAKPSASFFYDEWMESQNLPVYRGHFVPDLRTIDLGHWPERGCNGAFVRLAGMEGISEARITEVLPGQTTEPYKVAVDEMVYVISGSGSTTVWATGDHAEQGKQFEWADKALFLAPNNHYRQFSNLSGDRPARLLHYNYLPLAMSVITDVAFFFDNPYRANTTRAELDSAFAHAKEMKGSGMRWLAGRNPNATYWYGNFFPDMSAWDQLDTNAHRGAGGRVVRIQFADSDMSAHMSVFDAQTYKKAHRHGPGRLIVIPTGAGYSTLWLEGEKPVVVPWQEGALFVPPDRWFHQHFNLGAKPARYLALHPPVQFHGHAERPEDRARDQIEYPDEDPAVREYFEAELAKRGLASEMRPEAYQRHADAWA